MNTLSFIIIIAIIAILYVLTLVLLNTPGCTGTCMQGTFECDCPLRKDKDDIRQDKRT